MKHNRGKNYFYQILFKQYKHCFQKIPFLATLSSQRIKADLFAFMWKCLFLRCLFMSSY